MMDVVDFDGVNSDVSSMRRSISHEWEHEAGLGRGPSRRAPAGPDGMT